MFGFNFISKLSAILLVLSFSSFTAAAPYTVSYADTVESDAGPYISGGLFTISIVLDNGGATAASQTWTSAHIVSITFNVNDSPNTITTVLSPVLLTSDVGSFVTNASGALTAVPSQWIDKTSISTILSSNDPGGLLEFDFSIRGGNDVYSNRTSGFSAAMTNVKNNVTASFWTNPAVAVAPATPVPTMSIWGIGLLSGMIGLLGMYHRRRK
jgi:hypothetical protein